MCETLVGNFRHVGIVIYASTRRIPNWRKYVFARYTFFGLTLSFRKGEIWIFKVFENIFVFVEISGYLVFPLFADVVLTKDKQSHNLDLCATSF